jgi:hypothetical protein
MLSDFKDGDGQAFLYVKFLTISTPILFPAVQFSMEWKTHIHSVINGD